MTRLTEYGQEVLETNSHFICGLTHECKNNQNKINKLGVLANF